MIHSHNQACHLTPLPTNALAHPLLKKYPALFAAFTAEIPQTAIEQMAKIIHAIETVIALPVYQQKVLEWAPAIAQIDHGALGVFFGYDFHLTATGPKLIEINSNAGGAILNMLLAEACDKKIDKKILIAMFLNEWQLQRGDQLLQNIAIVDDNPSEQHLYPEFLLLQQIFDEYGVNCIITDPSELQINQQKLWHNNTVIDLVYNRLTDFSFEFPNHSVLGQAYIDNNTVITPHPRAHALYADKRNFTVLTNADLLRSWKINEATLAILTAGIPHTFLVKPEDAESLWASRRQLFFKPAAGYGSKGSYRGDRMTHKVFNEILSSKENYIAQSLALAPECLVEINQQPQKLKIDLRNFVYDNQVQLLAARLYRGQTTNFRTEGGGFAAVFSRE